DFLHGGEAIRAGLRSAPGDDDPRLRAFALQPAYGLARLAFGFGRDRAGIDNHHVCEAARAKAGSGGIAANHLGFVGVAAAPERDDVDAHRAVSAVANSAESKRPSNSYSIGPVINT